MLRDVLGDDILPPAPQPQAPPTLTLHTVITRRLLVLLYRCRHVDRSSFFNVARRSLLLARQCASKEDHARTQRQIKNE